MDQPQVRAWMFDLLAVCQMFQTSFSKSALEMAFNEGSRNVGLRLTADIMRVCPDNYVKMLREHKDKEHVDTVREDAAKRANGGDPGSGTGPEPGLAATDA